MCCRDSTGTASRLSDWAQLGFWARSWNWSWSCTVSFIFRFRCAIVIDSTHVATFTPHTFLPLSLSLFFFCFHFQLRQNSQLFWFCVRFNDPPLSRSPSLSLPPIETIVVVAFYWCYNYWVIVAPMPWFNSNRSFRPVYTVSVCFCLHLIYRLCRFVRVSLFLLTPLKLCLNFRCTSRAKLFGEFFSPSPLLLVVSTSIKISISITFQLPFEMLLQVSHAREWVWVTYAKRWLRKQRSDCAHTDLCTRSCSDLWHFKLT